MKNVNYSKCPVCRSSDYRCRKKKNGLDMGFCLNCTLAYTHPLIRGEYDDVGSAGSSITSSDYYSNILRNYDIQSLLAIRKTPKMQAYWDTMIGRKPKTILEIGCGTGQYYEAWKKLGVNWTGIEVNKEMLDFCHSKNIPVEEFSAMDESINRDRKYDVIFLSQVLEHILEPHDFLNKIRGYLADGGILHIDVPNHDSLTSFYRRANLFHDDYGFLQLNHHLIAYTKKSLTHLLKLNSFQVCHIGAYSVDDDTFGQLLTYKSLVGKLLFLASRITRHGSLLVCIAKNIA